ncbi:hypothetical protein [Mycobacterium nebraskense]|nr:hypothetical protein [Mycobacterium nebraskense]
MVQLAGYRFAFDRLEALDLAEQLVRVAERLRVPVTKRITVQGNPK